MNFKRSARYLALSTVILSGSSQAAVVDMDFEGLFTFLDAKGSAVVNNASPYYYDSTWGYGFRTQISGTLSYDTSSGFGSATVNPFSFLNKGQASISTFDVKQSGATNLLIGNMIFNWSGNSTTLQVVLDASGLFAELPGLSSGDVLDASTCAVSHVCSTPASEAAGRGDIPIGPVPIATSSFNVAGANGVGTTLGQLGLGINDAIGGSPMDNGPFLDANYNFDFTTLTVTAITSVPVPAAVWLFGSGLFSLVAAARCRKPGLYENK